MTTPPIQPAPRTQDVPLEQLAGNSALTDRQKIGEVSRQFESVLLQQILAETQKTVIHSEFSDDSNTSGIYRDMVTKQLADSISKSGSVGLAQQLEQQLSRQLLPASPAGHDPAAGVPPTALPAPDAARPTILSNVKPPSAQTGIHSTTPAPAIHRS